MEHYLLTDWIDFLRGQAPKELMNIMQRHLEQGCTACLHTVATWQSIYDFALREPAYEPPAAALRLAEAYFVPFKLASKAPQGIEVAQLAFDSRLQPLRGDVRGGAVGPRQLVYRCGDVCIDMRFEPRPGSNWVVLAGQVMDEKAPLESLSKIPVSLLSSGDTVSETITDEFGEFHLGFTSMRHLQLFLGLERSAVVVPLPDNQRDAA